MLESQNHLPFLAVLNIRSLSLELYKSPLKEIYCQNGQIVGSSFQYENMFSEKEITHSPGFRS